MQSVDELFLEVGQSRAEELLKEVKMAKQTEITRAKDNEGYICLFSLQTRRSVPLTGWT